MHSHDIAYKTISHPRAYTASQCAQAAHIKGNCFAKSIVVKLDGKFALVAIPANIRLDLNLLKKKLIQSAPKSLKNLSFKTGLPTAKLERYHCLANFMVWMFILLRVLHIKNGLFLMPATIPNF
ncbi:YbaK/prolyl-tRNA synthetase associated domain-containing protein [Legionella parisiensis]|uniref:YbaK/aminoacyl-tRNA synthetase-associated domain-containing protein n=1 Tax=Legionella parisiensis TaxID=45071 RepID=A0A1E5JSG1_9GAMM|nr:YbaK/prolyl-tRNA synthetase associated domain-containing protein [Legionella parisiensis]OEH46968.1 hypothetical protein lpari_02170 [Legionella parisiensis]STX76217.1 YbaK/prolyl-tRNA synthetase associated domain-containing protein [Legionella parisiensis]